MSVADLLQKLPAALNAEAAAGTDAVIQFNSSQPHYITIKGTASSPDVTLTMEDDDLVALMKGELNGMTAFMTGKLQLDGDLMLAQRIGSLFDPSKLA